MKTGSQVPVLGLYVSDCCEEELILGQDDGFPRCTRCHSLTRWELSEKITEVAFEESELAAA